MVKQEVTILVAEDDPGHAALVERNLRRAGLSNDILRFEDGQQVLDFLLRRGDGPQRSAHAPYVLLLDIRMPKLDGVTVLQRIREDDELRKLPVIMLTTTDDPREVERCHNLGCSIYITKPVAYEEFMDAVRQLGMLLMVVQVPRLNGVS